MLSYCSQIQRREHRSGEPINLQKRFGHRTRLIDCGHPDRGRTPLIGPFINGRRIRQRRHRQVGDDGTLVLHHQTPRIRRRADHGEVEFPFPEDAFGFSFAPRLQHGKHALLRFRQHHIVGAHVGFALRHAVEIEFDAGAALVGHLGRRRGQPCRAHVLDRDDRIRRHQFEAGFEQKLFRERIAHLHGRALFFGILVEFGGRHGGAVNAVAAGFRADINDRVAGAFGSRFEYLVGAREAYTHRIDEDVAVVGTVEIHFAADRRHAHAIAVAADAADHARNEMTGLGMVGNAEAQRVHHRDRTRAHGEHVAHDAADTGRRALIGLDEGGMIVAFHLEDRGVAVSDVDHAGIFARPLQHPGRRCRQAAQMGACRFVGAMLAPHDGEDAKLDEIGRAVQEFHDARIFGLGQAVLADNLRSDGCHEGKTPPSP